MHNRSRHHFRTHNMVDSVKTDRRREKPAAGRNTTQNKSQTIIHRIAWNSLLGIIIGEGRCDWPSIRTDFIVSHHTNANRMLITLLLSFFKGWTNRDALYVGPILGALTEGLQELDRSWERLFTDWWRLDQSCESLLETVRSRLIRRAGWGSDNI